MSINSALHKLLNKQIKKHLSSEQYQQDEHLQEFILLVNATYATFEKEREFAESLATLNDKHFAEINQKLKEESSQRKQSIEKLIKTIRSLDTNRGLELPEEDTENLLDIVVFLQEQIKNKAIIEQELRLAKEMAEKANQAKSEFLSMMSHEIRTPLNAIVGLTYLMQQEECPPAFIDNLKTLQFSTDNLYFLINNILDFSKIEAGKVELESTPFDFKQLVSNIKRSNQVRSEEKGTQIRLMLDDDIPDSLVGDSLRISQILSNLVSNAVKFTSNGSISIETSLIAKTALDATLRISVADTGIGIPKDKQQVIFERFIQANSATTRKFGGTGLGLVITKKLLELHGSKIELESEEGKGAKFSFTLKLAIGEAQNNINVLPEKVNEKTLDGVTVLLVEDYEVNIKVAGKFLTRWKIQYDVAENGLIALEKYAAKKYDVILMDLQMPEMDGYTATARIREQDTTIPIIALTASATLNNQDRAFEVGMTDYVTKPFNPKELFMKIAKYSGR